MALLAPAVAALLFAVSRLPPRHDGSASDGRPTPSGDPGKTAGGASPSAPDPGAPGNAANAAAAGAGPLSDAGIAKTDPRVPAGIQWNLSDPKSRAAVVERLGRQAHAEKATAAKWAQRTGFPRVTDTGRSRMELMAVRDGRLYAYITYNANAAISTAADLVRETPPYNLTGTGITVGVWDAGGVRSTHQELRNRVTLKDGTTLHDHSTHVGGTIGASGVVAAAKGMAPRVRIDSYEWTTDTAEMASRAMSYAGEPGKIQISNHSYGWAIGWLISGGTYYWFGTWGNRESDFFGQYDFYPSVWDTLCYNAPYYLPFQSAGNDRSDGAPGSGTSFLYFGPNAGLVSKAYAPATDPLADYSADGGFDTLPSTAGAKNILTVGSASDAVSGGVRATGVVVSAGYSSYGPTDDGRVKPDITANGEGLYSTVSGSDSSYNTYSGTSMAAPNTAGSAALLIEHYGNLFTGGFMRASTLKGLILHTADDLGRAGPDYAFGWGLMNTRAAADLITRHRDIPGANAITEAALDAADPVREYEVLCDGTNALRATLCWTDPPAVPLLAFDDRTPRLINDLDLRIVTPAGATNLPYALVATNPSAVAVHADNRVDNVEQVFIASPPSPGSYRVRVSHKGSLYGAQQVYSLLISGSAARPEIEHVPLPNTTNTVTPYAVEAVVTPRAVLDTNRLYLLWNTTGSSSEFTTNTMILVSNELYSAQIPAQPAGATVHYHLRVESVSGFPALSPTNAPSSLHRFDVTEPVQLVVTGVPGPLGAVVPGYGTTPFPSGAVVAATAGSHTAPADGTRYACTGWFGAGSVPAWGSSNHVTFVLAGDSELQWQWAPQFALAQSSSVSGIFSTDTWWAAGSTGVTVAASASATVNGTNCHFAYWLLDEVRQPDPTNPAVNPVAGIVMSTSRIARARYVASLADEDSDGLPDWWEYYFFGITNVLAGDDADGDGFDHAREQADRTNPRDAGDFPTPPVITHAPLDDPQRRPAPWHIEATIADNSSVTSATVHWLRASESWQATALTNTGGTAYTGAIPAPGTNGNAFSYYIIAYDAGGNSASGALNGFQVAYPLATAPPPALVGTTLLVGAATNATLVITNFGLADLVWTVEVVAVGYASDFSAGTDGWTHGGTNDFWHLSGSRWLSASPSWYFGAEVSHEYENGAHAWLRSPVITLGHAARLSYWQWLSAETENSTQAWDGAVVELSTNGGATYAAIVPEGGYPFTIVSNPASPFAAGTPCFAGAGGWQNVSADLSGYAGRDVHIRLRFGSDGYVTTEGWFVDNLTLSPLTGIQPWLQLLVTNGVLAASGATNLALTLDTAGVASGTDLGAWIRLRSNDHERPAQYVPVVVAVRSRPTVQLVYAVQTSTNGQGLVTISNRVYDADREACSLETLYSVDSGATWTGAWIAAATGSLGSVAVSNEAALTLSGVGTSLGAGAATNSLRVTWATTNGPLPVVLATGALLRMRSWDGLFWSDAVTGAPFLVDNEPPSVPTNLSSSTHAPGTWSSSRVMRIAWNPAGDGLGSGVAGYAFVFTNSAAVQPPLSVMTAGTAAASSALGDGTNWWAAVRALDGYGNYGAPTGAGPFRVDATAPLSGSAVVTAFPSAFGAYVVGSVVTGAWSGFSDALSGIAGYYFALTNASGTTNAQWTVATTGVVSSAVPGQTNTFFAWPTDLAGNIGSAASAPVLVLDPAGDWDGDGSPNAGEEIAGTAADSAESVFVVLGRRGDTNALDPVLRWPHAAQRDYAVFWADADAYADGLGWPSVTNPPYTVNGGWAEWTDPHAIPAGNGTNRFYRLRVTVSP